MDFFVGENKQMNFMEAVKAMKEGKKVTRQTYTQFRLDSGNQIETTEGINVSFNVEDYEATDWEIYKEEDDWNLADKRELHNYITDYDGRIQVKDIKTFISKIKEDITKYITPEFYEGDIPIISKSRVNEIIDKRAGKL